jgi:hypothetical protein
MNLPDSVAAFAEIRRVLWIEGVLGSRHNDWSNFLFAPIMPKIARPL